MGRLGCASKRAPLWPSAFDSPSHKLLCKWVILWTKLHPEIERVKIVGTSSRRQLNGDWKCLLIRSAQWPLRCTTSIRTDVFFLHFGISNRPTSASILLKIAWNQMRRKLPLKPSMRNFYTRMQRKTNRITMLMRLIWCIRKGYLVRFELNGRRFSRNCASKCKRGRVSRYERTRVGKWNGATDSHSGCLFIAVVFHRSDSTLVIHDADALQRCTNL